MQVGAILNLESVTKEFLGAEIPAVLDVNLSVQAGEFVTFLGPSGSGKTTTLNMIAGFTEPTSGVIKIHGRSVSRIPSHKRNLGMVFQNYALFPHMTVWENVAFPLQERRVAKVEIRQKVIKALELVGLTGYEKRRPNELSGGQQQRVALTRALVFNPEMLLMDEPLGALDKKLRQRLQFEIKRLHRELGMTFLFVTHDQEEAMALSDRVVVFNQGQIIQVGTPEDLYRRPNSRFVAEFLGDSNIIEGVLIRTQTGDVLRCRDGDVALDAKTLSNGVDLNGDLSVMFRPEDVYLHEDSALGLPAQIMEIIYLGAENRVLARTPSGQEFIVRCREIPVGADIASNVRLGFSLGNAWLIQ